MVEFEAASSSLKQFHEGSAEKRTPSSELVYRLAARSFTPVERISSLRGKKVKLMELPQQESNHNVYGIIGKVTEVEGRNITLQPQFAHLYLREEEEEKRIEIAGATPVSVNAYYITRHPLELDMVDDDPSVKIAVFCSVPPRIDISEKPNFLPVVGFSPVDPTLDSVLREAFASFPRISTIQDLIALTKWIHEKIVYNPQATHRPFEKLGVDILNNNTNCTQLTALEMAILELYGFMTIPLSSLTKNDGHMFLGVDLAIYKNPMRFVVDPTWNLVGTYSFVQDEIRRRGGTGEFHRASRSRELLVLPNWDYADREIQR